MEPKKILAKHSFLKGLIPVIIGHKSNICMETGIIYAPYIPLFVEEDFRPRRSIASRYARKIVNNSYYGIVSVGSDTQDTEI